VADFLQSVAGFFQRVFWFPHKVPITYLWLPSNLFREISIQRVDLTLDTDLLPPDRSKWSFFKRTFDGKMTIEAPDNRMRVLVVDDHLLLAETVVMALSSNGLMEVESVTGIDAALGRIANSGRFDVVLLDYSMPGGDGLAGLRHVIAANGKGVAVFSGVATPAVIERALAEGAMGFIPKTLPLKSLESAVRMIAQGEVFVPYNYVLQVMGKDEPTTNLKPRERQVLQLVCEGAQNKEIAFKLKLSEVIVKADVKSICRKLGVRNRTEAAMMARNEGLC
jgi:DNA-binding NarL/FixJ family response regulator